MVVLARVVLARELHERSFPRAQAVAIDKEIEKILLGRVALVIFLLGRYHRSACTWQYAVDEVPYTDECDNDLTICQRLTQPSLSWEALLHDALPLTAHHIRGDTIW
jgi:hypothetical protein